jgi:hypothetical protein
MLRDPYGLGLRPLRPMEESMSEEPRIEVVSVPLGPEMQRAMAAAAKVQEALDEELNALVLPDTRKLIDAAEQQFMRWVVGDGS